MGADAGRAAEKPTPKPAFRPADVCFPPSMATRKSKTPGPPDEAGGSKGPSELLLYTTPDQQTRIEVRLEDETVWLTQRQMAELFDKSVKTINEHVQNVYAEGELPPAATIRKSRIVQDEGGRQVARDVDLYNLDVIIRRSAKSTRRRSTTTGSTT